MRKFILAAFAGSALIASSMASAAGNCIQVQPKVEDMRANFHANYLPNFIPVVVNSEAALNLSAEQCQIFNEFRTTKGKNGKALIEKINQMEKESQTLALAGASLEEMKARHVKIAELREKLMVGKMNCHQFVKKNLTAEQYDKLINEVYPAMLAKAQARI
ncbi:hypothetical protein THMIRHAS_11980 [Thiosulfatimonas sediminis]|uniref:Uncharacterized protein n=1 Tax=Thiosulfatimonas sediminis TaxID=2675054 RepID=A0A6F8PUM6_9GAMM|nr:hypothetical protein [Thiosulfatimonas sediminis]BBP45825.1 hypothetical protein THMIRHAS_11980 [Thiosulfatimonas sediminis]